MSAEKETPRTGEPCVYCGGGNHPALCGEPIDNAPFPWVGVLVFVALPLVWTAWHLVTG